MLQVDIHGHLYVGKWQPIMATKLSKAQGVLHFLNMADVSRLLLLGLRVVQLPWPATHTNFLINPINKLNIEQSK